MATHMIRLFVEPPNGEAEEAVNNWVENHTEWEDDPVSHELREANTNIDGGGTEYLRGDYRFLQDSSATEIIDGLADRLDGFQGGLWYRIGYHECDHDESESTPCEWEQTREGRNVPDSIPTF